MSGNTEIMFGMLKAMAISVCGPSPRVRVLLLLLLLLVLLLVLLIFLLLQALHSLGAGWIKLWISSQKAQVQILWKHFWITIFMCFFWGRGRPQCFFNSFLKIQKSTLDWTLSKGNQDGKISESKFFFTSVKNWKVDHFWVSCLDTLSCTEANFELEEIS